MSMVQYNTQDESNAAWGMLEGRSIPTWKFSVEAPPGSGNYMPQPIGFGYVGRVAEEPQQRHAIDFTTKQPKFYADGNPIMEIILTLDTDERVDEDDDGQRRWYMNGQARRALQDEMKRLGIKRFGIGTLIQVQIAGFKPNPKGRATMLFDVKLQPTEYVPPVFQQPAAAVQQVPGAMQGWAQPQPAQQVAAPQQGFAQGFQQGFAAPAAPAQPQGFPAQQPVQGYSQVTQQFAQPQQPQQSVPVPDFAALYAAQQQAPAPQQQAPIAQPVQQPVAAAQPAPQAPAMGAPGAPATVTNEHIGQVQLLMQTGNIDRATAIQAVADMTAPGDPAFYAALEENIPF